MLNLNDQIEIQIEKMANEGKGLGRYENQVIFVPFAAPGDRLKVAITRVTKNFSEAEIIQIISPSKDRVTPPCPYYGECGGCNFQHIDYDKQLEIKTALVKETLEKFLKMTELPFQKTVPSPKPFHYRNRIQLHSKAQQYGFHKRKTHQILPIESCLIAEESLNRRLPTLKTITPKTDADKLELYLNAQLEVKHRWLDEDNSSVLFSQVNRFQNTNLIQAVSELAQKTESAESIFDLYAGSGNFSFPLAELHGNIPIYAIELSPHLVKEGHEALKLKPKAIHFIQSPVEFYLRSYQIPTESLILLDPPRVGCHPEVMTILGATKRKQIIYISCNYVTLARDLSLLKSTAHNWGLDLKIHSIQCFDMFPQTDHIEVMVSLSIS